MQRKGEFTFNLNLKERKIFVYPMIKKKALPSHSTFSNVKKQIMAEKKKYGFNSML